ncbi:hypothetical protein ERX46_04545 [Brumimicrobium glaciale]|uniref:Gliding motility-associated protein GldM C-terminal domain-containing protein n=1 Tax=Brumimicrobium glaciale TaxID=200475 RepID=A0A4Q4KRL2_9FLAO|nr:hypothetical protein [Brumimicrobium glaciale]RYM34649.1 hypothetical protein ERX46_04545 [Brumimicrobium glaciale]
MTKNLTFILLILISFTNFAQESVLFEIQYKPNKNYITKTTTTSLSEVDFVADEEIIKALKDNGIDMPMIVNSEVKISSNIFTDNINENGETPATMNYGEMISTNTINGETKTEKLPLSGSKITGKYDKDFMFHVDSIHGENISVETKRNLITTIESVQQSIKFPEQPMKVGDTFKSEVPMSIPIDGMNPVLINISIEYYLKEIKEEKAFFDIVQTVGLDMSREQFNMSAKGTGSGSAIFDIKEGFLTKFITELPMDMTLDINEEISMKLKVKTKSEQITEIK